MMKAVTLFSGSSGNCIYLKKNQTEILVDAGGSLRQIAESLSAVGSEPSRISAVLVTHEHSDHTKGLSLLTKKLQIPVYCQQKVAKELYLNLLEHGKKEEAACLARCIRTVEPGYEYEIGDFTVAPFVTPHDSMDSQGFTLEEKALGIATDLGHVSSEVAKNLLGCKTVILESNHDLTMLQNGPYPPYLKERVASDHGHLNNEHCAAFAAELLRSGCENLTLFHLSAENNTPELAYRTTCQALEAQGACVGSDVLLQVADRFRITEVL